MVVFCLLSGSYLAQAQTVTEFTPENQFPIPANNGTINFAVNGTYAQAKQENNSWIFSELKLFTSSEALPYIQIAIQNCTLT